VLLASAIAPVCGALIVGADGDAGSLAMRAGAIGCDLAELDAETDLLRAGLSSAAPGLGRADTGEATVMIAATSRRVRKPVDTAGRVLSAALLTRAAVFVDCPDLTSQFTKLALASATHVAVFAPQTPAGLLDAEFALEVAERERSHGVPVVVVAVDVRGRGRSRGTRAALCRARALSAPVLHIPFDQRLADATRADWSALRPNTQAAITAVLTESLLGKDTSRAP
jgi:hypothetical protein